MKKLAKIVFSLIVVLSFISGCGSSSTDNTDSNVSQSPQTTNNAQGNTNNDVNTITENNLIDKPTTFELSDIANKTFKVLGKYGFIDLTFDSNGVANVTVCGKNYEFKFENGIIKVYENDDLIGEYKKVKADSNGIILLVKDLKYNEYWLWSLLTTIKPVDMSTLNYPFTVYEGNHYVQKITFENDKVIKYDYDGSIEELNSTIEDGKIVAINEEDIYNNGNSGYKYIHKIQYIGEIDKYKIAQVDNYYEYWEIDNSLVGLTFNDIIGTNQSIYGYILHSDGTASTTYNSDANITYELISSTEINLTECYDIDSCYTINITLDPDIGKIAESGNFSFVTIYSEDPIITNYVNNSYRVLPRNSSIKDKVLLKYKKLRKKPF